MKHNFLVSFFITLENGGKKHCEASLAYRKPLAEWKRADYELLERYIARLKPGHNEVSIINVKELPDGSAK